MRIAIPIHGDRVMPRFGCAREMIIATVEDGRVLATKRLTDAAYNVQSLSDVEQVSVLICGGIHPRFQQLFQKQNIKIIWGVAGPWQDVLHAYLTGTLQRDHALCMRRRMGEGCHHRQRHQGR